MKLQSLLSIGTLLLFTQSIAFAEYVDPEFFSAVRSQETEKVAELLANPKFREDLGSIDKTGGPDVGTTRTGSSSLAFAASNNNIKLVKLLIKYGADPNFTNLNSHVTPVHRAVINQNTEMVKVLLDAKGDPNYKFEYVAKYGTPEILKLFIKKGVDINKKPGNIFGEFDTSYDQASYLHIAVRIGSTKMVEALIKNGAKINTKAGSGETALYSAVKNGYYDKAKLLIENGASQNLLGLALKRRDFRMAELFIDSGFSTDHIIKTLKIEDETLAERANKIAEDACLISTLGPIDRITYRLLDSKYTKTKDCYKKQFILGYYEAMSQADIAYQRNLGKIYEYTVPEVRIEFSSTEI